MPDNNEDKNGAAMVFPHCPGCGGYLQICTDGEFMVCKNRCEASRGLFFKAKHISLTTYVDANN